MLKFSAGLNNYWNSLETNLSIIIWLVCFIKLSKYPVSYSLKFFHFVFWGFLSLSFSLSLALLACGIRLCFGGGFFFFFVLVVNSALQCGWLAGWLSLTQLLRFIGPNWPPPGTSLHLTCLWQVDCWLGLGWCHRRRRRRRTFKKKWKISK